MRLSNGLVLTLLLFCTVLARPAEAREQRWTHFGLRPLGMGNAYVAVADDYNALFYNPAGLARLKSWYLEVINPGVELADHTYKTINQVTGLAKAQTGAISDTLNLFKDQTGRIQHLGGYLTPYWVFKHFGVGIGLDISASLVPHSDVNIEFDAGSTVIAPVGLAFNFFDDRLSLGATLKMIGRAGVTQTLSVQSIATLASSASGGNQLKVEDYVEAGKGHGMDVGLLFTPTKTMEPTLGVSIIDLGGSTYQGIGSFLQPQARQPAVNVGLSLKPWQTKWMSWLVSADAHMINRPLHYSHKLNFGTEFDVAGILKLQGGLMEGYATGGFQFDISLIKLRAVTYVVDHGPVVGADPNLAERRYAIQLKMLI